MLRIFMREKMGKAFYIRDTIMRQQENGGKKKEKRKIGGESDFHFPKPMGNTARVTTEIQCQVRLYVMAESREAERSREVDICVQNDLQIF